LLLLAACESDTTVVPLDEMNARFYLRPSSGPATGSKTAHLEAPLDADGKCPVLPDGTTFKLDGVRADDVDLGGAEAPHGEVHCLGMSGLWESPAPTSGPSTIEIDDGDTTWTFIIDRPFEQRSFRLVTPASGMLRSGDAVTVRIEPPSGTLSNAKVDAGGAVNPIFSLDESKGLVIAGHEIRFTVPAVGASNTTLTTWADLELAVERCDAPLGCDVKDKILTMQPITLSP
jgi:hypothetical protein